MNSDSVRVKLVSMQIYNFPVIFSLKIFLKIPNYIYIYDFKISFCIMDTYGVEDIRVFHGKLGITILVVGKFAAKYIRAFSSLCTRIRPTL